MPSKGNGYLNIYHNLYCLATLVYGFLEADLGMIFLVRQIWIKTITDNDLLQLAKILVRHNTLVT